ncbi:MAG: enoyl-CoA hydratase-related protein [Acidobacteria bacterium]|nr:enoyl-CoA hydratase-related protein [Acidobacteriota bacterium]
MANEIITFSVNAGVGILTLNRPHKLNAFNVAMVDRWSTILEGAINDPDIRVIIVTGAGRAFCAGGDATDMLDGLDAPPSEFKDFLWHHVHAIPKALERLDKPVIAALNGTARGAGLDMALMCDLRIAAESAVFAESYINLGLIAGDGGTYYLPRLIGSARALELFWTGDEISAREAERIGLVNRVVPDDQVMKASMDLARKIAGQPQEAIRYYKRAVRHGTNTTLAAHLDMVSSHMAVLQHTPDHRDRVNAFLNRPREAK